MVIEMHIYPLPHATGRPPEPGDGELREHALRLRQMIDDMLATGPTAADLDTLADATRTLARWAHGVPADDPTTP